MEQIKNNVTEALKEFEPTDVRIYRESADVLKILVVSPAFRDMSVFRRIDACSKLLVRSASLHYLFIIEPVTPEEFKTRNAPWPE